MTPRLPTPAPRSHCEGVLCNHPHDGDCDCPCSGCVIVGLEAELRVVVGEVRSLRMMIRASTEVADSFLARAERAERGALAKADAMKLFADERDAFQTEVMRLRSGIDAAARIARESGVVAPGLTIARIEGFLRDLLKPVFAPEPVPGSSTSAPFEVGDLVRERAGGPVMRVARVLENGSCDLHWTMVSPSGLTQTDLGQVFPAELLVKVHEKLQESADASRGDRRAREASGNLCSTVGHGIDEDPYGDNLTAKRKQPTRG